MRGVDAVVHCAAFFRGATAEQAHAVNDVGTQHLANAARAASVTRFVFTSTGLVYGPNGGHPAREDDACAPLDGYPKSKLAAERFLLALEGFDVRIVRLLFVYGDGDAHIAEAVPMMSGFPPAQRMSIAHHADVAEAVARVLDAASPAHRIYNLTDDEAPDLATLFASVGEPPPDGSNAERARFRRADGRPPAPRRPRLQTSIPKPPQRDRRGGVSQPGSAPFRSRWRSVSEPRSARVPRDRRAIIAAWVGERRGAEA